MVIRPALKEELPTLFLLYKISNIQGNDIKEEIDFDAFLKEFSMRRDLYEQNCDKPNKIFWVLEGNDYETENPLYGGNGRQLYGFISGSIREINGLKRCLVTDFYTVPDSPNPSGRDLFSQTIVVMKELGVDCIELCSTRKKSSEWYENRALLKHKTGVKQPGELGNMVLVKERYMESLENLAKSPKSLVEKQENSLDSCPQFT